jgi:hypothetical protein
MFRSIIFIAITVIALSIPVSAAVTVVESTPSRLVLSWEMRGFDTASVYDGRDLRTRVSYNGGYVPTGDSGAALMPGYTVLAGVPPGGAVRVSVEPVEVSAVRVANPLRRRGDAPRPGDPVFSSRWASEPSYGMFRDYRAAQVVLRPVHDLGQGRVQVLRRARVVIEFPAAAHSGASWQPRGDYERMVERLLLNFREAQGWQQGGKGALRRAAAAKEAYPFGAGQRLASFRVGDGNRNGNEGTTKENALIRISGKKIREALGLDPGVPLNSVALYASLKGEMDVIPPREGEIPAGVFEVPVLRNEKDDYLIAYVSGSSDWSYDTTLSEYKFVLNRYDDYRTYWLAAGGAGASMGRFAQPPAGASPGDESFDSYVYMRTPTALNDAAHEGGIDWYWRRFSMNRADTTMRLDMPGIDEGYPGAIWIRGVYGEDYARNSSIEASLGWNVLCADCGNGMLTVDNWRGERNLSIRFANRSFDAKAFYELNAVQLRYRRFLNVSDTSGRLDVFSSAGAGVQTYRLSKSGDGLAYVIRVPLDEREISLVDTVREQSYAWSDAGNTGARYMVSLEKDIVDYSDSLKIYASRTAAGNRYLIRDLRGASNTTDYLIVTHEDFLDAALKLAGHKAEMGFASPKVVLLGDVLNQFSGGNTDPAALRNFLLHVYREWDGGDRFSYVAIFGSGHYDYKSVSSRAVNYMPVPYISNRLSDDFYVFFDASHPDAQHKGYYFIGRLPAKGSSEALDMVDKIIEIEDPRVAEFDSWRGRVLMAADDDQQGASGDNAGDHTGDSEKIAVRLAEMRPDIDIRKLYLFEYEWDERYFKPGATRALINEINNGVSVVNWFGHGDPALMADERLMQKEDVMALYNRKRYPLVTLFSCSIGKFDRPGEDCLASMLVRQPRAGAIAVVASAREVWATNNRSLAEQFFDALYDTTGGANLSIGSVLNIAKARFPYYHNRFFVILGDPSITLTERGRGVSLAVADAQGAPLDTLKALQQVTMKGAVTDMQGRKDDGFGGPGAFVSLTLFNPPQDSARRKDGGKFTNPRYSLPGSPVFSAKIPVTNGEFEQQLLLPMNLTFGKPGVKLAAYVWKDGDAATGTGYLGGLVFEGSESGGLRDTSGPRISVRPVYNTGVMDQAGLFVRNRVTVQLPLTLEVGIEDSSGINVISSGPDEGLSMEVRGALSKRAINHLFQFSEGSFRQGTATLTFEESELKSGSHELIISAQDLLGNVTRLSVSLEIVDPADIRLDHVINVPNPVRMGRETGFYYYHSNAPGDLNVNVTIRVYSLGGRLLAVIRNPRNGERWVPRDGKGNLLTPNVYLYQVTASSPNVGRSVKSKVKKLVVHPPK